MIDGFLALVGGLSCFAKRVSRRLRMHVYRPLLASHGCGLWIDPDGFYSYKNIHVGSDVTLGLRPVLMAQLSEIRIGNHVMFGPEVVIIGGGHNITKLGCFMTQVNEKTGNEDLGVTIEDDVWVGTRAIILRGVTVGRGAVVGAGAVVTKSVPPYAIVAGNPAKVIRYRWTVDTILRHEEQLYPAAERLSRSALQQIQSENRMLAPKRI